MVDGRKINWALSAGIVLALVPPTITMTALGPVLPMIADHFGGGDQARLVAQQAQSLPFLGLAVGGLCAGAIIAQLGLRVTVLGATVFYVAVSALGGLAQSPLMLLAGCFAVGFAASVLGSALVTTAGASFSEDARPRILGFQTALADFSSVVISVISTLLADALGWRGPFLAHIGLGALLLILLVRAPIPTLRPAAGNRIGSMLTVIRSVGLINLCAFLVFFVLGTQLALMPFLLADHGFSTPGARTAIIIGSPIAAVIASTTYGLFSSRLSDRWMTAVATVAAVGGYFGLGAWSGGVAPITCAAVATGAAVGLSFPLLIRATFRRTPADLHSYAIGILNSFIFTGAFLGPAVFGPLSRGLGLNVVFYICAAAWLVGGVGVSWKLAQTARGAAKLSAA